MKPSVIVWDLETVPDLGGFAAANDLVGKADVSRLIGTQDEEPGGSGGETGNGGRLGTLTAPAGAFSAASHKTSTLRSPAFASPMILLAIISSVRSAGRLTAARAVSNAMPMRRAVSGSKFWPLKKGLMGTRAPQSRYSSLTLSAVNQKAN